MSLLQSRLEEVNAMAALGELPWQSRNADWKHILHMSLFGGRVGSVARTLRMYLLTLAEHQDIFAK